MNTILLTRSELPLSCPKRGMDVGTAHPRVYLSSVIEKTGKALCPYCGTQFRLRDFELENHEHTQAC